MKRNLLGGITLILGLGTGLFAQEETFTDEELTKYATVMQWAENEQANLQNPVKDSVGVWLDESEVLSISRYNDLSKVENLEEADASAEEKEVYLTIQDRIEKKKNAFKETYVTKIKEDIGAGLYNRLKKALKADTEIQGRYESILDGLGGGAEESEAGEG